MADGYLEKRMEESLSKNASKTKRTATRIQSINTLLKLNRSYRGYNKTHIVSIDELNKIVRINNLIPSAKNQQVLRFKLVTQEDSKKVLANIKMGAALPELNLPLEGTEPEAFIIICTTIPENKWVDIDLGISIQSMLLKAAELKLNGLCIGAFNKEQIKEEFNLQLEPLLILAIGKAGENIKLTDIRESENHAYYRSNNYHYVPKVIIKDLIL